MKKFVYRIYQLASRRLLNAIKPQASSQWSKKLHELGTKIESQIENGERSLKILVGPSFAIWNPCYALDLSLAYALRVRGAKVIPIYCDGIQETECNFFGGPWNGRQSFTKNCMTCQKKSQSLWSTNPTDALKLSHYIQLSERQKIREEIQKLSIEESLNYEEDGIKYGFLAKDITVNNYLVASLELIPDYENLLKTHISNLIIVSKAYKRILQDIKPDRVICNDSYYGMWAVLEHHCKDRLIPFYSHWPTTKDRIAFGSNEAAMNLDFRSIWPKFSEIELSDKEVEEIDDWLLGKRGLVIDITKPSATYDTSIEYIHPNKPTILLAANVIWDLAALNKQIIFDDMADWIIKTIQWFEKQQDYQLIIKPHPVEVSKNIPTTRETIAFIISEEIKDQLKNTVLLKSETHITASDLEKMTDIRGVVVHTTTVGFEFPARGLPCITTGRSPYRGFGFTIDPENEGEYFNSINVLLSCQDKQTIPKEKIDLAYKFIKFYQFHYYSKLGLFRGNSINESSLEIDPDFHNKIQNPSPALEHVLNSILDGTLINFHDRWIPKS